MEKNIEINLCDLGFSNGGLIYDTKAQPTKEKITKLDFTKIKNVHQSTLLREKTTHRKTEDICISYS